MYTRRQPRRGVRFRFLSAALYPLLATSILGHLDQPGWHNRILIFRVKEPSLSIAGSSVENIIDHKFTCISHVNADVHHYSILGLVLGLCRIRDKSHKRLQDVSYRKLSRYMSV